jgi:hypothetical protein
MRSGLLRSAAQVERGCGEEKRRSIKIATTWMQRISRCKLEI